MSCLFFFWNVILKEKLDDIPTDFFIIIIAYFHTKKHYIKVMFLRFVYLFSEMGWVRLGYLLRHSIILCDHTSEQEY